MSLFELDITGPGLARTVEIGGGALTLGAALRNDVVIAGPDVAESYLLTIAAAGTAARLAAIAMSGPPDAPATFPLGAPYAVGAYALTVRAVPAPRAAPFQPRTPEEAALLVAIGACDREARAIYADWLDSRGDARRAGYVRAQDAVADRLGALDDYIVPDVDGLPLAWRVLVARAQIAGCDDDACPRDWGTLAADVDADAPADERTCPRCDRAVPYCARHVDGFERVVAPLPTAFDLRARIVERLAAPYGRVCAHCGHHNGGLRRQRTLVCAKCRREMGDDTIAANLVLPYERLW